ncbi:MAG: hypothetical protein MJ088_02765 [Clostridia bacterium]|nr:hypothetical protein [Clostridia bacterium]
MKTSRRLLTILLALVLMAGTMILFPAAADGTGETVRLYRWKRVYTQADLPDGGSRNCLIFWNESGTVYCTSGTDKTTFGNIYNRFNGKKASSFDGIDASASDFYTETLCDSWWIEYKGLDSDYKDSNGNGLKKYYLTLPNWETIGTDAFGNLRWNLPAEWTISTSNSAGCKYQQNTGYGMVQFIHNVTGRDDYVGFDEEQLYVGSSSSYDYPDFAMYLAYNEDFSVIAPFTVRSGATYSISGNTLLRAGGRIVVESGATLTVSGTFICNGTIENHGSLIIEPGAVVTGCSAEKNECCSVICCGSGTTRVDLSGRNAASEGHRFIAQTARLSISKYGVFELRSNASCAVEGLLVAPDSIVLRAAEISINKSGAVYFGYLLPANPGAARNAGAAAQTGTLKSGSVVIGTVSVASGTKSHVKKSGIFKNNAKVFSEAFLIVD